jgi:CBS domain-containing protein
MKCSELMHPNPEFCVPDESLLDALEIMEASDVGSIPVVDARDSMRPVGIVTDRDAALHLARNDRRPSEVLCRDAMSSPAVTCEADDDAQDAFEKMKGEQLRRMLIVQNGKLVGIIAQADIARQKPGDAKKVVEEVSKPASQHLRAA